MTEQEKPLMVEVPIPVNQMTPEQKRAFAEEILNAIEKNRPMSASEDTKA